MSTNDIAKVTREISAHLFSLLASLDNEGKTSTPEIYKIDTLESYYTLEESVALIDLDSK